MILSVSKAVKNKSSIDATLPPQTVPSVILNEQVTRWKVRLGYVKMLKGCSNFILCTVAYTSKPHFPSVPLVTSSLVHCKPVGNSPCCYISLAMSSGPKVGGTVVYYLFLLVSSFKSSVCFHLFSNYLHMLCTLCISYGDDSNMLMFCLSKLCYLSVPVFLCMHTCILGWMFERAACNCVQAMYDRCDGMWQQKLGTAFSDLKKNTAQHALIAPWREQNYALPPPHAKQIRHIILYFPCSQFLLSPLSTWHRAVTRGNTVLMLSTNKTRKSGH